jgi:hypothetical protein
LRRSTYLKDADCIAFRERPEKGESLPSFPQSSLQPLHSHVREYEFEQRTLEQYKSAKLVKELAEQVKSHIIERKRRQVLAPQIQAMDRQREIDDRWTKTLDDFDRKTRLHAQTTSSSSGAV